MATKILLFAIVLCLPLESISAERVHLIDSGGIVAMRTIRENHFIVLKDVNHSKNPKEQNLKLYCAGHSKIAFNMTVDPTKIIDTGCWEQNFHYDPKTGKSSFNFVIAFSGGSKMSLTENDLSLLAYEADPNYKGD